MAMIMPDAVCTAERAAALLALLEDEGVSPAFFAAFEDADAKTRWLVLKWLTLALSTPRSLVRHAAQTAPELGR
jgi:hypothetical protein